MRAQVSHELSVPAVTAMLLSALAFATAAWSGLALADALTPRARAGLQSLAALAALGVTVVVRAVSAMFVHPAPTLLCTRHRHGLTCMLAFLAFAFLHVGSACTKQM